MRLWHLIFAVASLAVVLTLCRDPMTRTFVIVFLTGLGELAFGLAAVMALFQTVGALGEARGVYDHAEALAATTVVLATSTALMSALLFAGAWLVATFV